MQNFKTIIEFIKQLYNQNNIDLHKPVFKGKEKEYLTDCINSTYVSYIGKYVDKFEESITNFTHSKYAIATVNGTCALHLVLKSIGLEPNDEVITQSLTFIGTINAISYCFAKPVFIDVDKDTLGMSPESLNEFLNNFTHYKNGKLINKVTGNPIKAILPVHVLGHPCRIDQILEIANKFSLPVIEDAAQSLGTFYKNQHTGTYGLASIISFNGNKIITTGGGGMVLTQDKNLADKIKYLSTTAKLVHPYEYIHTDIGYNYRMPNINAALGLAQMEYFDKILENKRKLAFIYKEFFKSIDIEFINEPKDAYSNYWLNGIILKNKEQRENFLKYSNENGVKTRGLWRLINKLDIYSKCFSTELPNSEWLGDRVVNIPSGVECLLKNY